MHARVLDLDGSITSQDDLVKRLGPTVLRADSWGPRIRMACRFARFRLFENALSVAIGSSQELDPVVTLFGSGDFHHVTLALLRRLTQPFCNC